MKNEAELIWETYQKMPAAPLRGGRVDQLIDLWQNADREQELRAIAQLYEWTKTHKISLGEFTTVMLKVATVGRSGS